MDAPVKVREQLPRVVRFDLKDIRNAVRDVEGFNAKLALVITRSVGTMACAYLFAAIALISLPAALSSGQVIIIVAWIAQTFLQLVLLSIIMVGQKVGAAAADKQALQTFNDAEALLEISDSVHRLIKVNNQMTEEIQRLLGEGQAPVRVVSKDPV